MDHYEALRIVDELHAKALEFGEFYLSALRCTGLLTRVVMSQGAAPGTALLYIVWQISSDPVDTDSTVEEIRISDLLDRTRWPAAMHQQMQERKAAAIGGILFEPHRNYVFEGV